MTVQVAAQNRLAAIRRASGGLTMTPYEETAMCHNLKRVANALERQNDLIARIADMGFLNLTPEKQAKVEAWDKRRFEENSRLHAQAYPAEPPSA